MQTTDLAVQFSDFDYPAETFAATKRHHIFVSKRSHSITAECGDCHIGMESQGHDEASRLGVAAWVKRHEAQA